MNALALGLLAAVCWGFHDLAVRYISQSVSVIASLMTVLVSGAVLQAGLLATSGGYGSVHGQAVLYAIASGGFYLLAGLSMYAAFQRGPVRLVAPLVASYPVLSVAMAIWRGATVDLWHWLAVIAIGLGVSIVAAQPEQEDSDIPPSGLTAILSLLAAVGIAGAFALGQYASELSDEYAVSLIARLTAISALTMVAVASGKALWPGLRALPLLCVMGLLDASAIVSVVAAGGLPNAQYASVTASVFGLLTVVLAWAILKERMRPRQWLGCLVAFAGIGYLAL
ncbi:DMT family transporter [Ruegeria sp. 2012CJ41-6]|uniref:DMT family transporter n=1 Tax=Ruegeria spongiae TaxID=2942209 RepID=A0ABT0Q8E5_9RHOB|nr:DMT family transporter [Ruegeria spongiae]MCL6286150.1 DMT family transporter [Ruegeria spongiae]